MPNLTLKKTRMTAGGDVPSAKRCIVKAAQSGDGIIRLTTQTGTRHEVAALVLLTGSTDVIGSAAAAVLTAAGVSGLTSGSTWGTAVTQIAAS